MCGGGRSNRIARLAPECSSPRQAGTSTIFLLPPSCSATASSSRLPCSASSGSAESVPRSASPTTWRSSAFSRHNSSFTGSSTISRRVPMERLIQELRTSIVDNFFFGDASGRFTFTNDDSFQQRGIVDSTGILELVCHLQERYGLAIDDAELVPD